MVPDHGLGGFFLTLRISLLVTIPLLRRRRRPISTPGRTTAAQNARGLAWVPKVIPSGSSRMTLRLRRVRLGASTPLGGSASEPVASIKPGYGLLHQTTAKRCAEDTALLLITLAISVLRGTIRAVLKVSFVHHNCR